MATQFRSASTDEWTATRFFGGTDRGVCFDFGADRTRYVDVLEAAVWGGESFVDEAGHAVSGEEFATMVANAEVTFGEYGGTFEVGRGDVATFEGF